MSTDAHDVAGLRRDYGRQRLTRESLDANPFAQFKTWMDEAIDEKLTDANAMSLATVNAAGELSMPVPSITDDQFVDLLAKAAARLSS